MDSSPLSHSWPVKTKISKTDMDYYSHLDLCLGKWEHPQSVKESIELIDKNLLDLLAN